ncbi:MAG: hypothetical protein QF664_07090 [Dehalococcoidia bacterium]|jgi:hypothetical protein|nr:hypothetical protein [Dehalococcoidia bacterium]
MVSQSHRAGAPPRPAEEGPISTDAFATLTLTEVEEAAGELHRRIAVALRRIGEQGADQRGLHETSPRQLVAALVATVELAAATLGAVLAGTPAASGRSDRHPATIAATMYAAPTVAALLSRLEQDRRLLASLARQLESRLDGEHPTAWGRTTLRAIVTDVALTASAACAQDLERRAAEATA